MKNRFSFLPLLFSCLFLFAPSARAWQIRSFDIHVSIDAHAAAVISETIQADFGYEQKHGIFRDIPIHYSDPGGQHFKMRLHVLSVTDEAGRSWHYTLESEGRYQRIRIGSKDQLVTGLQTYRILYKVTRGAVRFFKDHDEFYWNLTGNEWAVGMDRVRAEIDFLMPVSNLRVQAFRGIYGSAQKVPEIRLNSDSIILQPQSFFSPYEGLTAAVAWDKGAVEEPSLIGKFWAWIQDNWVFSIPLVILAGMLRLWQLRGRDPKTGRSIEARYEAPCGLSPGEAGVLMDQRADMRDITSSVIDLAVRGYLKITPLPKTFLSKQDYLFENTRSWIGDGTLKSHERAILEGIFSIPLKEMRMSDLEQKFYITAAEIKRDLYSGLVKDGYFDSNPETVRTGYFGFGIVLGVLLMAGLSALYPFLQISPEVCILVSILSAAVILVFAQIMPRRTMKGAMAADEISGFVEFIKRADEDRLKRINDPSLFEKGLPYALAFGVVSQWTHAFENIYTSAPQWYGGTWSTFSPVNFGNDLNTTVSSMGNAFVSQPSSSSSGFGGGGFSGGGGGGGGGGSW